MICPECNIDRKSSDFLGKSNCYKCQYKKKIAALDRHYTRVCKGCGDKFLKSNRWIYCSSECQRAAEIIQKREYWTNHVAKG